MTDDTKAIGLAVDGGLVGLNPARAGTYAYVAFNEAGEALWGGSGIVMPQCKVPTECFYGDVIYPVEGLNHITNNITELIALINGVMSLPMDFDGIIYSDSFVTLCRMFKGGSMNGVPQNLRNIARMVYHQQTKYIRCMLLDGHPNPNQLIAKVGKRGRAVSEWNKWCDQQCTALAKAYVVDPVKVQYWSEQGHLIVPFPTTFTSSANGVPAYKCFDEDYNYIVNKLKEKARNPDE